MPTHDEQLARRSLILAACEAELINPNGLHELAHYVIEHVEDVLDLLQRKGEPDEESERWQHLEVIGLSPAALKLRSELKQLSRKPGDHVYISGESGTGRRHCARVLHSAARSNGPLLELNAANSVEVERQRSHLRHVDNSQARHGAAIHVTALCQATPSAQLMIAELGLCGRVIASSSIPLARAAAEGRLRPELAFHFRSKLELAPLRDRPEDVPLLARHFAERIGSRVPGGSLTFNGAALELLQSHSWPGNVAELERLVRRIWSRSIPGASDSPEPRMRSVGRPLSIAGELLIQVRERLTAVLQT